MIADLVPSAAAAIAREQQHPEQRCTDARQRQQRAIGQEDPQRHESHEQQDRADPLAHASVVYQTAAELQNPGAILAGPPPKGQ